MGKADGLKRISEDIEQMTVHTAEQYAAKKRAVLAGINPKTEYAQGGAIFCKRCGKMKSLDEPDRGMFLNCICECESSSITAQKEREEKSYVIERYRKLNFNEIGETYKRANFFNLDMNGATEKYITAAERCEKFCDKFDNMQTGHGIWLYGASGVGKTHLAACIMNKLENEYARTCIFTTMDRLLTAIKSTYKNGNGNGNGNTEDEYLRAIELCDCLIIDDLGRLKPTGKTDSGGFALDKFSNIISRRYDGKRPVVITSNFAIEDMTINGDIPKRICDRLIERQVIIPVTGVSRRVVNRIAAEF